jgi:hypothetical protein
MFRRAVVVSLVCSSAGCFGSDVAPPGEPDAALAACSDGVDNDGDGLIDLEDRGCVAAGDDDESGPPRECNDEVDNDDDGFVDLEDPDCEGALDDEEQALFECEDELDNDGDGKIDYPFEPGCVESADDSEVDPIPPPECSDGIDNDENGFTDYPQDYTCLSAADPDEQGLLFPPCGPAIDVVDLTTSGAATGTIEAGANELQSAGCGGQGAERVFSYSVLDPGTTLVISTDHPETTVDTVLYVVEICNNPDTELGCDDDGGERSHTSMLTLSDLPPGTYYIIVDSFGPGSLGDFKLTVE